MLVNNFLYLSPFSPSIKSGFTVNSNFSKSSASLTVPSTSKLSLGNFAKTNLR